MMKPSILLAYDDAELRFCYQRFLSLHGFDVETVLGGVECLAKLREKLPDVLILDMNLRWGGPDGVLAVMRQHANFRHVQVLLTASKDSFDDNTSLVSPPVVQVLTEPHTPTQLLDCVRVLLGVPEPPAATLIRSSGLAELRTLNVHDDGEIIVITGQVSSYYLKQMAQETIRPCVDGRRLSNRVVVEVSHH
jgi:DNA-binding response OmpR family regulator